MQVNLHDAKTHLSRYVEQALDGEEVVIARAGKALVRLVPVDETPRKRELGFCRGLLFWTATSKPTSRRTSRRCSADGDSQLLLWLAIAPERLPATVHGNLSDRHLPLLYRVVSLWEVAIKTSLGQPGFLVDAAHLHDGLKQQGVQELGIEPKHRLAVQHLHWIHRDPYRCAEDGIFDRLLVAQAIHHGNTLLTADRTLRSYGHQVIWIGNDGSGG